MPAHRRGEVVAVVARARSDSHRRDHGCRVISFRLHIACGNLRDEISVRLIHICGRASGRHDHRPIARRVRAHGLSCTVHVRDGHVHIREVRLRAVLRAVAVRVEVKMPGHRSADVVSIVARARVCARDRRHRRRVGSFRLRGAGRDLCDEIGIRFIHIRARRARRNAGRPVAVCVGAHREDRPVCIGNDDIHVRQIRLAYILHAVAVCVEIQMPAHRRSEVVAVDARIRVRSGHGGRRRRISSFRLRVAGRHLRDEIRIGLADICARASRRHAGGPIARSVRAHCLCRTRGIRDHHIHIRKIRLCTILKTVAVRVEIQMPVHHRGEIVAVVPGARRRSAHGIHRSRIGAFRLRVAHWHLRDKVGIRLAHIRCRVARRHCRGPVAVRVRDNSLHRSV